jgi:hypothetical protein
MECPICRKLLSPGNVALGYTFWGFMWAGLSRLTLFFRVSEKERLPMLSKGESLPAHHCQGCGTVVIPRAHQVSSAAR